MKDLKASIDTITTLSVPLSDFNKFDALDMLETLQNAAHNEHHTKENYYSLACRTIREKTDLPPQQFRALLLLPLMGDKDHEKVYDIIANVEKNYKREQHSDSSWRSNYYPAINSRRRLNPSNAP